MHELSIAMSIVDVVQEEAKTLSGVRVQAVYLKLGQLSGVVKEALLFSWELACQETALQGARLAIEEVPAVVNCSTCRGERPVHSLQSFCCAECGTPAFEVVAGREILVTALEVWDEKAQDISKEVAQG